MILRQKETEMTLLRARAAPVTIPRSVGQRERDMVMGPCPRSAFIPTPLWLGTPLTR